MSSRLATLVLGCGLCLLFSASYGQEEPTPPNTEGTAAPEAEPKDPRAKLRDEIKAQEGTLRAFIQKLLQSDEQVKPLHQSLLSAEKAYHEKLNTDPTIKEAEQAQAAASQTMQKTLSELAAASPEGQQVKTTLQETQGKRFDLDEAVRMSRFQYDLLKRRLEYQDAEVSKLRQEAYAKRTKHTNLVREQTNVVEAKQAMEAAHKALEASAEYKAYQEAKKAYEELLETDPTVSAAKAAQDESWKTFQQALEAKAQAHEKGAAFKTDAEAKSKEESELRAAQSEQEKKYRDFRRGLEKSEGAAAAKQALDAASENLKKVKETQTAAEREAIETAKTALDQKIEAMLQESPEGKAIREELLKKKDELKALEGEKAPKKKKAKPEDEAPPEKTGEAAAPEQNEGGGEAPANEGGDEMAPANEGGEAGM